MDTLRQIQVCKWTGTVLGVLLLSATIGRWNAFKAAPTPGTYAGIFLFLTLFLLLLTSLAVVVYAEEKVKGRLNRPRPFFERWSNRFFPNRDEHDQG
jgi:uncharacterized membrane protein YecN with MAPEG domain